MADATPEAVLRFWFGESEAAGAGPVRREWFVKDETFDALIARQFGTAVESALAGGFDDWSATPRPALAQVILLDQFPRNLFRGLPRSFAGDARALAGARRIVASGWDRAYTPVERWFAYLPFEHSESLDDQDEAVRLFGLLRDDPAAGDAYEWAVRHRDVIVRFGRFPHRNPILGRPSTAEELAFLATPGSRF